MPGTNKKPPRNVETPNLTILRLHYELMRAAAHIAAPVMRVTGFRFSKAWRGNKIISHVEANLLADGIKPDRMRF